jgi:hypothetical protein
MVRGQNQEYTEKERKNNGEGGEPGIKGGHEEEKADRLRRAGGRVRRIRERR